MLTSRHLIRGASHTLGWLNRSDTFLSKCSARISLTRHFGSPDPSHQKQRSENPEFGKYVLLEQRNQASLHGFLKGMKLGISVRERGSQAFFAASVLYCGFNITSPLAWGMLAAVFLLRYRIAKGSAYAEYMSKAFLRQAELLPDLERVKVYYGFPLNSKIFNIEDMKGFTEVLPTKTDKILFTLLEQKPLENSQPITSETIVEELGFNQEQKSELYEMAEQDHTGLCWMMGPKTSYYFYPTQPELLTLVLMGEKDKVKEYWEKIHKN